MSTKGERRRKLLAKFRVVGRERVAKIESSFGDLEAKGGDSSVVDAMMREIHTLKGEARLMGFEEVSRASHLIEDLLAWSRERDFRVTEEAGDTVYGGMDLIRGLLDEDGEQEGPSGGVDELETSVRRVLDAPEESPKAVESLDASEPAPPVDRGPRLTPSDGAEETDAARGLGELEDDFVRIQSDALAELTNLAAELAMHHESLAGLLAEISTDGARKAAVKAAGNERFRLLKDSELEVRVRIEELQERVRELRLLRVESLFERYPPATRKMAHEQGKKVRVLVEGGQVSVDKQVLDHIDESLLHLVRNAIDHGIESEQERRGFGKPARGTLLLGARQLGSQVEIRIEDDGRGVCPQAVRAAAIERGVIDSDQHVDDDAALQLLFQPGFSTKQAVTDISGRGVGLDVVKAQVESLGGSVRLTSSPGRGAVFAMSLPVSVALTQSLVFRSGSSVYALPSGHVTMAARPDGDAIEEVGSTRALRVEGSLVPLLDMSTALGSASSEGSMEGRDVVVVEHGERKLGLVVDELLGERQTVHQPLGRFFEGLSSMSAAVLLEGGSVGLVINVPEVMRSWGAGEEPLAGTSMPVREEVSRRRNRILLVDDSELTRDMLVGIAARFDLEVVEAVNGRQALDKVRESTPDMVLTDIDMPVMDGLRLIEELRSEPLTRELPIVVLSTRGSPEDKKKAMAAGADGYLVKLRFDEGTFKELLNRFLAE